MRQFMFIISIMDLNKCTYNISFYYETHFYLSGDRLNGGRGKGSFLKATFIIPQKLVVFGVNLRDEFSGEENMT